MCPDPQLRNVKGLLEIKEDWPPCAFTITENSKAVSIDTGALRFEAQRDRWKYVIYDKQGEIVLEEHIRDADVIGAYRAMPLGFTTREGKIIGRMRHSTCLPMNTSTDSVRSSPSLTSGARLLMDGTQMLGGQGLAMFTKPFPFI